MFVLEIIRGGHSLPFFGPNVSPDKDVLTNAPHIKRPNYTPNKDVGRGKEDAHRALFIALSLPARVGVLFVDFLL